MSGPPATSSKKPRTLFCKARRRVAAPHASLADAKATQVLSATDGGHGARSRQSSFNVLTLYI